MVNVLGTGFDATRGGNPHLSHPDCHTGLEARAADSSRTHPNTGAAKSSEQRRTLEGMQTQRNVVSHALQRRHTLEALRSPQVDLSAPTACDADPMLVRAAMHHGEPLNHDCPVCESPRLALLRHAFGHQLGQYSGRIRTLDELEEMEHQFGEFHVYEVEVCPDCLWNHILVDYVLGDGRRRRPPRHQPTVEDIYG